MTGGYTVTANTTNEESIRPHQTHVCFATPFQLTEQISKTA